MNVLVQLSVVARLLALTIVINLIRYVVVGPIEGALILESLHSVVAQYPTVFDQTFDDRDYAVSLIYNFVLWFVVVVQAHLQMAHLRGHMLVRSLQSFTLAGVAFAALAAVYMNHFDGQLRVFFIWSIIDAALLFPLLGVANGLLYPLLFRSTQP